MKKVFLSVLIAIFTFSYAMDAKSSVVDKVKDTNFIKDTKISFKLRNHWKYLKESGSGPKIVHNAWGQSAIIDYKSGYIANFIGFDATYSRAIKLGASDYFSTRGLLSNNGNGFDKDNAGGFSKFNQRYVKIKLDSEKVKLHGKAGWQILKDYGVLTRSTRLAENSYFGYSGTMNYGNFTWDNAYVTSAMNRESPDKVNFQTNGKEDINSILTSGLTYKNDVLSLSYAFGEAKKYSRMHVIETSYKPMKKLTLRTQMYGSYALDQYHRMPDSKKAYDNYAWHYAADAKWKEKDWSAKLGIAYTDAKKSGKVGYYHRHLSKNTRGRFNAMTSAGSDYTRDGELALTLLGTYNFIPDLMTGLQVNYGQFNYKGTTVRNGELSLLNIWTPRDDKGLNNFSVFTLFGCGWGYKNRDNTPILNSDGSYKYSPSLSGEVVVEYRFDLFK